ncbi:MAG: response regulator transcription factor [Magnetococcales bacterium]|nr:response regulator transcription factor [Magnetococcales bacterium]
MRVLVVEDDVVLCNNIKLQLVEAGFAVDEAHDGAEAEYIGSQDEHDVIVLDLGLPVKSGLAVLKEWRRAGNDTPVIVLTARNAWHERVEGIEAGADDYLGKPFHKEELVARLKALIRRSQSNTQGQIEKNGLRLDEQQQAVFKADSQRVQLTGTEFRLLRCFMLNSNRILSKESLMDHIYDYDSENDHNVIEVYVNRLRKLFGKKLIRTFRGQGYQFVEKQADK